MKKLSLLLVILGWFFACTYPEQHKASSEVSLNESQMKLLTMTDEEFLNYAKHQDPIFKKKMQNLDENEVKKDKLLKERKMKDEELRQIVNSETSKRTRQAITEANLEESSSDSGNSEESTSEKTSDLGTE